MRIHTRENKIELSDVEWDLLSERTEGYSGSDIANMTLEALFGPIRDLQTSSHWKQREGKVMTVKVTDIYGFIIYCCVHGVQKTTLCINQTLHELSNKASDSKIFLKSCKIRSCGQS